MVTRNIICMGCEFEGKVEAHDTVEVISESMIFKSLGKDPDTGYLLLRCPCCVKDIAVDPLKTFFKRKMKGYPVKKEGSLWAYFQGKDNTDEVIVGKAINIASHMIDFVTGSMDSTFESLQKVRNIKMDKVSSVHAILETLIFSIHAVERAASEFLEVNRRNIFSNALLLTIRERLPKDLQIDSGSAETFRALFDEIYSNRREEYGKLEYTEDPEQAWGEKDTLYREFAGRIVECLGLEVDLATDNNIQSLYVCAQAPIMLTRNLLSLGSTPTSEKTDREVKVDFSQRTLCSDGNCIGVINEQGVCNTCGKPYK